MTDVTSSMKITRLSPSVSSGPVTITGPGIGSREEETVEAVRSVFQRSAAMSNIGHLVQEIRITHDKIVYEVLVVKNE